jgi:hypothetical protein
MLETLIAICRDYYKVVDQPTTGKSSSFSTLTCKTPAMQEESVVTKVKVSEFEFIS